MKNWRLNKYRSLTKNKLQTLDDDDFLGLGNVTNMYVAMQLHWVEIPQSPNLFESMLLYRFLNENELHDIAGGTFAEVYGLEVLYVPIL